jgi:hypothetical protein
VELFELEPNQRPITEFRNAEGCLEIAFAGGVSGRTGSGG